MQRWLSDLNAQQKEAVLTTEGQVRVLAGPGTGKTRTLTARYCYLAETLGVPARNILCVTFTNKAANEMKQRIRRWLGDLDLGYICTLHAFCVQFLKEEIHVLHYPKNFLILDVEDQRTLLLKIFEEMGITLREATVKQKIDEVLEARKLSADTYIDEIYRLDNAELEKRIQSAEDTNDEIFWRYLYEQKKSFACDFNDLINFTAYILKHFPDILNKWQERMQYVLVDEFQDVSAKQYAIARMLAGKHGNLFIVGDPDQTIYTWRNAHVKLFLDFDKVYPNAKTIVLGTNYRSSPEILKAADALIQKNLLRFPKELAATKPRGGKPLYFHAQSEKEEADWIASEIQKLVQNGETLDQIAVLYRSHYLSRALEESFARNSLPYKIYSGIEFYARAEIKDCVCYLRMLTHADDIAFLRTINTPSRKIGKKKLDFLKSVAESQSCSLYEALRRTIEQEIFRGTGAKKYVYAIESVKKNLKHSSPSDLLQQILDLSGYENYLRLQSDQERLDNVAELKRSVAETETDPDATLEDFLAKAALLSNLDRTQKQQAVKLMTIHSAKGMEFPYVFICGLNEGVFPSRKISTPEEMDEERRIAYVAMTRAIKGLYLSDSEGVSNDNVFKLPSRFIFDCERENLDYVRQLPESFETRVNRLRNVNAEKKWHIGERVKHPVFGVGTITAVNEKALSYRIKFDRLDTERDILFRAPLS